MTIPISHSLVDWLFGSAWFFVVFVSIVDGYLLLECRDVIAQTELNPLGIALLALAGGQVWLFLLLKLLGTIIVSTLLLAIYHRHRGVGFCIAMVIAGFQFVLLAYLHIG